MTGGNVDIKITTVIYPIDTDENESNDVQTEEINVKGVLRKKDDSIYLFYEEKEPDSGCITRNSVKIEGGKSVTRTCSGYKASTMRFVDGSETATNYVTKYGTFAMKFMTNYVSVTETDKEIRVSIEYILSVDSAPIGNQQLTIWVKYS